MALGLLEAYGMKPCPVVHPASVGIRVNCHLIGIAARDVLPPGSLRNAFGRLENHSVHTCYQIGFQMIARGTDIQLH